MAVRWPWKASTNHLDDGQPSSYCSTQTPSTVSPVAARGAAERLVPVAGRAAHLSVALSVLVPVALVALTIYLVLKILFTGTGWEDMRRIRETQQEILEIPRRIDPGADQAPLRLGWTRSRPRHRAGGVSGARPRDLAGAQLRKRVLLALAAATAIVALVVVVGVFWFGWHETRQNRELLGTLPVYPGAEPVQDFPHPSESDENPISPPDKWVILRTYRVPDGTTKEDVAAFYMEWMPPEWERCLRHASTYDLATGREGVLFTGAAFYSERTLVSVDVLNLGGSTRSYDVFLDRHRNMRHDPCEPQPFTTDPACYDLEPPAGTGRLISRDEAERATGWIAGGPAPGGASAVEIEGVTASCLTTFGAYAQRFYRPGDWSNTPPDTPVWVLEIKGVLRSLPGGGQPWQYVTNVPYAESGDSMEGARYLEPRLAPTVRDGS